MKNLELSFTCPACKHTFSIKVKEMVPGRSKNCPHCQLGIVFSGDNGKEVQKSLDDLEKALKNLKF